MRPWSREREVRERTISESMHKTTPGSVGSLIEHVLLENRGTLGIGVTVGQLGDEVAICIDSPGSASGPDFKTLAEIADILGTTNISLEYSSWNTSTDCTPMTSDELVLRCLGVRLRVDDPPVAGQL